MQLLGTARLAIYYAAWICGCASVPISLGLCIYGHFWPLYCIFAYYSFRFVKPATYWPAFKTAFNLNTSPYCDTQKIIFEKGASVPKPNSKTMVAVAPHGILTLGWSFLLSSDEFFNTRVRWLVAESLFYFPFISDFIKWADGGPCTRKNMLSLMSRGVNVGLIPGGFQEATLYERGRHKIYIKDRKGFIKYALQFGYKVIPCYCFGEELTYWTLSVGKSIGFWLNKYNIPGTIFIGKFLFLPSNNIDFTVVVGKALEFPLLDAPTDDDVDKYHAQYVKAMVDIFERNKAKYCAQGTTAKLELF